MDLSSGTSGVLLGIGLAGLGVGVALKILKSVESEVVLKKEPPPSTPRHYDDFTKLEDDLLASHGMLSEVVIQGKVKKIPATECSDGPKPDSRTEVAHDESALLVSDLKAELARYGAAGKVINTGDMLLYGAFSVKEGGLIHIPKSAQLSFSNPFFLKSSKGNEITVESIDMSVNLQNVLEPHDLHCMLTGKLPLVYIRHGIKYNMLTYGSTIAVIGSAKLQDDGKKIIFTAKEVSDSLQSFIPQENLKTLPKNTSTILIIGGLSLIVVAGLIAVALWCFRRRRGPQNARRPIEEQGNN